MDGPKSLEYYLDIFDDSPALPSLERCWKAQYAAAEAYIDSWPGDWKALVSAYADLMPEIHSSVRVIGLIPARNEQHRITSCLNAIKHDVETSEMNDAFELIVLENGLSAEIGATASSINNWILQNKPSFRIRVIQHTWGNEEKYPLAKARKLLADITVYRIFKAQPSNPVYLLSEDADIEWIQAGRMRAALLKLDKHPSVDAIRGIQERSSHVLKENYLALLERRSWQFAELLLSSKRYWPENNPHYNFYWHRVVTAGSNVFFSAEIYSLIGGYSDDITVFEDMDIGQRISVLRGTYTDGRFIPRLDTIHRFPFREESSIARVLLSLVNKGHVYSHDGTGFYEDDHIIKQPRSVDILLQKLSPYARPTQDNISMYETVINGLQLEIQRIFKGNADGRKLFSRVMSRLGIKHINDERHIMGTISHAECPDFNYSGQLYKWQKGLQS